MLKTAVSTFVLLAITATGGHAAVCALDVVPASTLLLPYYEVDLERLRKPRKSEVTTVTLSNHSDVETLVHVTVWTQLVAPVVAWDVPLPPLGSVEIPLFEIFTGDIDDLPGKLPGAGVAPPGVTTQEVIARATGEGQLGCLDESRARGYITFDVAGDGSVFGGGEPADTDVITGTARYDQKKAKYGALEPLVHLESTGSFSGREGLSSLWAIDFDNTAGSTTEIVVWRDPQGNGANGVDAATFCDSPGPNGWYPLDQLDVTVMSRDGEAVRILTDEAGASIPGFPFATGVYKLGRGGIELPFEKGTVYLDLRPTSQAWVGSRLTFGNPRRQGRAQAVPVAGIDCNGGEAFSGRARKGARRGRRDPGRLLDVRPKAPAMGPR